MVPIEIKEKRIQRLWDPQEGAVGLKSAFSCLVRCVGLVDTGERMVFWCIMLWEVLSLSYAEWCSVYTL